MSEHESKVAAIVDAARETGTPFTILGGGGFIGTHAARFLARHRLPFQSPVRDDEGIFARPLGHVIYAAGLTADYATRPFETIDAHVGFLSRVLERGRLSSLVYLSSTRLYDQTGAEGHEDGPLIVRPENPRHLFDLSKGLGEALCIRTHPHARIARLSSVYASDLSGTNFLNQLVRAATRGQPESLETSPNLARDYVDVEDVIPLLLAIAVTGTRRIYNVASGENLTNEHILEKLAAVTGNKIRALRPPTTEVAPRIDVGAISSEFGFRPASLEYRLEGMVESARKEST